MDGNGTPNLTCTTCLPVDASKRIRLIDNVEIEGTDSISTSPNSSGHGDFLSNLPESILSHILSYLSTNQVLQTSVLSKNWRNKWTCICNLNIQDCVDEFESSMEVEGDDKNATFVAFMNMLPGSLQNSSLKSVQLTCNRIYPANHLSTWISALIRLKPHLLEITTSEMDLMTPYLAAYPLVDCLSDVISLTELKISSHCNLKVPGQLSFNKLKILKLGGGIEIENMQSDTDQLLLVFPVLEGFELGDCEWLGVISVEISAPQLFRFKFCCNNAVSNCKVKIHAEKLGEFESYGYDIGNLVVIAPSVYYASFSSVKYFRTIFGGNDILVSRMLSMLKRLPDVQYLRLSSDLVKAVISEYPFPRFNKVKHLYLSCLHVTPGEALFKLLKVLPSLEFLCLHMDKRDTFNYDRVELLSPCMVPHLTDIEIEGFLDRQSHFQLAKLILKHTENLQSMTVLIRIEIEEQRVCEIQQEIVGFAETVTSASVVVTTNRKNQHEQTGSGWIRRQ